MSTRNRAGAAATEIFSGFFFFRHEFPHGAGEFQPSGEVPPEYELALRDIMTRFVQSLGEEERLLFLLRYRNMEPVEAIARRLHKSPGAVKTALFRCREKLRKALKKEGIDV